jgi:hypothetical protein
LTNTLQLCSGIISFFLNKSIPMKNRIELDKYITSQNLYLRCIFYIKSIQDVVIHRYPTRFRLFTVGKRSKSNVTYLSYWLLVNTSENYSNKSSLDFNLNPSCICSLFNWFLHSIGIHVEYNTDNKKSFSRFQRTHRWYVIESYSNT